MITVKFFTLLRLYLKVNQIELDNSGGTVSQILHAAQRKIKIKFLSKLLDKTGNLKQGTIILVNGQNILHSEKLETVVKPGDEVSLFPPGGGG
jgi:molybdopterin synthase sulfur carrier subunit